MNSADETLPSAPPAPRREILVLVDHYLPGEKSGGPVWAVAGFIQRLGELADLRILTRDHDMYETARYRDIPTGRWLTQGASAIRYLRRDELRPLRLRRLILETHHDVLYVNSLFTWALGILPLVLYRSRLLGAPEVVLAPRGQLAPSALRIRAGRKRAFLVVARLIGLYRGIVWQATGEHEVGHIRTFAGSAAHVVLAPDLTAKRAAAQVPEVIARPRGALAVAFVSRIAPMKNLEGALMVLKDVAVPVQFNIYGPVAEEAYWSYCRSLMNALPAHISVHYYGPVPHDEVFEILSRHDLLFLPSRGENFGHVIIEALSVGCPVLTTDMVPWNDLAEFGAGWTLSVDDSAGFRRVIEALSQESLSRRQARSAAAHRYATERQESKASLRQMAKLFRISLTPPSA